MQHPAEIAIVSCSALIASKASTLLSASGRPHSIFDLPADVLQFLQEVEAHKIIFLDTNTFDADLSTIFRVAKEVKARVYFLTPDGVPSPFQRLA